jgi:integrase
MAWTYQKPEQVKKFGEDRASWYVGWFEPDGRKRGKACGAGFHGQKIAEKLKRKLEAELMTGTYQMQTRKVWEDFCAEYESRVLAGLAMRTRGEALTALAHFERLVKPIRVFAISTAHVDQYIEARRQEVGLRKGELLSPATLNKGLRHIKAALNMAVEWGYLAKAPRFHMQKEPGKLPTYVTPEHFVSIYKACDQAKLPRGLANITTGDWWRALLVMAYLTGWRIGSLLALRREDVDLDGAMAISRAADNKGKRDQKIPLHPVVVEHLKKLAGFGPLVFPPYDRRRLFEEFARLQKLAGIRLTGPRDHYGFHDLRRAFATMNADKLTPDALQALMQHKDYQTTQRYINMARQLNPAVAGLFVPALPQAAAGVS